MEGREKDAGELRAGSPDLGEFFARGQRVSISARTGNDLMGYVCGTNEAGLLLDVRDPSGDPTGYDFLPWSSIERVSVEKR